MDKEVLEVVLKKSAADSQIERIIDMKMESALPKGENYTSTIFRMTLKVVLGDGRITKKYFILKKEDFGDGVQDFFQKSSVTKTEALVYIDILRNMDDLIEEFGDTEGSLWCNLIYFSQADSTIILEDLKASGFSTVKRTEVQDLDHARLALRGIARFHAMAKVLEERGLVPKERYGPCQLLYNETITKHVIFGGIRALIKGIRATWGEEWTETANKLSQITFEDLLKKIRSNADFDDNTFKCLNHGDCWNNNMMFKHNWEGRPIEMRLIDFQGPHHNTPCVDVIYFMYTSIKPHVRHQHYQGLVELYHDSLISCLDRFGFRGTKPSLGEIEEALTRLRYFAQALFIGGFAIEIYNGTDAFDVKKVFQTGGDEGFNLKIYSEDGVKEKIGEDIKSFLKLFGSS